MPYTDDGWDAYEAKRREHIDQINMERRLVKRAESAPYWKKRREAANEWLASTSDVAVPPLPSGMPAHNEIDHSIAARIADVDRSNEETSRAKCLRCSPSQCQRRRS